MLWYLLTPSPAINKLQVLLPLVWLCLCWALSKYSKILVVRQEVKLCSLSRHKGRWINCCVSFLWEPRGKMPFHHVTAGLLYKGNYLNRSLSDESDSEQLASISVEELAGKGRAFLYYSLQSSQCTFLTGFLFLRMCLTCESVWLYYTSLY